MLAAKKEAAAARAASAVDAAADAEWNVAMAAKEESKSASAALKASKTNDGIAWALAVKAEQDAHAKEQEADRKALRATKEAFKAENERHIAAANASATFKKVRKNAKKTRLWLGSEWERTDVTA